MEFKELPEFKELYQNLENFHNDKTMSSYSGAKSSKVLIKSIIQWWLDENAIDANIRLESVRFNNASSYYWRTPYDCITVGYVQLFNGKGSIDKKSRWLNKITIRASWFKEKLQTVVVNSVARTDKDFLEPTPSNFKDFIHDLFNALVIRE